ncbi:hypothetical protein [Aurantimonas sp. Leaf443]|uniref:hypothetical protein n=1 Tax=Aurantimonas sp. Leaf443 TaxID=1736378 RepID=UPI0007139344|nr:hypothetical protein [Aurantimonas sp. Leaf443]KQT86585.1 hypothetical protein ASG48_17705 [Aurantimonas sp. Leaf443]
MQLIIEAILSAHAWVSTTVAGRTGFAVPLGATLALPFLAPLVWAATLRSPAAAATVAALAWIAASSLSGQGFTPLALAGYATALALAFAACGQAISRRNAIARLEHTLDETEAALMAAFHDLDRERLWRRAGGDARTTLNDEEIASLIQRFEEFRRTSGAPATEAAKATEKTQAA